MKKMAIITFVLVFSACSKQEPPKTVDYFLNHQDEMKAKFESCEKTTDTSEECKNAATAKVYAMFGFGRKNTRVPTLKEIEAERNAKK